ncbi:alanine racemase [Alkalihalobacillus sp. AL-G]|uniref:alanine racemase n=1 Tax=Alkalihalobacillus sp. AL-G TaxID=2926399 RepID=UPI00272CC6B8|nr:alanine racemase [Alkalihalobacillus sp. AL-G]WLD93663.1 alanine racemase [Alkalihalobacillus sp. AL-G]
MHFYRDTWAEINLDHIRQNYLQIQGHLSEGTKLMGVVKANGYGHGAVQVAKVLIESGIDYLAVAVLDEALELRNSGIKTPILVMGFVAPQYAKLAAKHRISLTVFQEEWIDAVDQSLDQTLYVHLKIDTGMGRLGINGEKEAKILINKIQKNTRLKLEGAFTHFATADELDSKLVNLQRDRFSKFLSILKAEGVSPEVIHMGNSAGAIQFPDLEQNYVRVGISLYGLSPSEEIRSILPFTLLPALSLHSNLSHVKKIKPGDTISYGATYRAEKEEWIGTIPIGYADGWLRKYAEKGEVLIEGQRAKIVGRICMDQFMVRMPHYVKPGTKITLIGSQNDGVITVDEIARQNGTINYEIPCLISSRVPRCFMKNAKIVETMNEILNFS